MTNVKIRISKFFFSQNVTNILILTLIAELMFVNSVSGVSFFDSAQIILGVAIQIASGIVILWLFDRRIRLTQTLLIGTGFFLGIFPIIFFGFVQSPFARTIFIGAAICTCTLKLLKSRHNQLLVPTKFPESPSELERIAVVLVTVNLVFARFEGSILALFVTGFSLILIFIPRTKLSFSLNLYGTSLFLITSLQFLFLGTSNVFTEFRIANDRLLEQAWGNSIISNVSLSDPFLFGHKFQYHFIAFVYDASFTNLWRIDALDFGPTALACCVFFAMLLVTNSALIQKFSPIEWWRISILVVFFGSWPFWESFSLDDNSPSQLLSLGFALLALSLMQISSTTITIILLPILVTITFLTKAPTGFFIGLLYFVFFIVQILSAFSESKPSGGLSHWTSHKNKFYGLLVTGILNLIAYLIVFGTPIEGGSASSKRGIGLTLPKIYWTISTSDFSTTLISILCAFALIPIISFFILNFWPLRQSLHTKFDDLRTATIIAVVLNTFAALFLVSKFNLNHYFASTGSIFGGLTIFGLIKIPRRKCLFSLQCLIFLASVSFLFLIFKIDSTQGKISSLNVSILLALCLAFLIFLRRLEGVNIRNSILVMILLVNLGNSIGSSWSPVRWTGYDLSSPNSVHENVENLNDLFEFSKTHSQKMVVALDIEEFTNSTVAQLIAANTSTQFWATPNVFMEPSIVEFTNSTVAQLIAANTSTQFWATPNAFIEQPNEYLSRIYRQILLTNYPNNEQLNFAKSEGVTHLLFGTHNFSKRWRAFLASDIETYQSLPSIVFADSNYTLVEL